MIAYRLGVIVTCLMLAVAAHAEQPATRPAANDPLPKTPGHTWLRTRLQLANRPVTFEYIIYLPEGYDKTTKQYPLLLFLHGNGDQGTNLQNAFKWGPGCELERPGNDRFRNTFPLIVLYPECPPRGQRWDQPEMVKVVHQLLDKVIAGLRVDRNRVYLTGLSMGGTGSWHVALAGAEKFAGIGEFARVSVRPQEAGPKFKYLAIWGITGDDDRGPTDGNRQMADAVAQAGGWMKLTAVPHGGHSVQEPFYASPQWYEWLLARHRLSPAERKAFDAAPKPPSLPKTSGHYDLDYQTQIGDRTVQLSYQLSLPKGYAPGGRKFPMVVFLHEHNAFGTEIDGRYLHGVELAMATSKDPAIASLPAIVLSPRCEATSIWRDTAMCDGVHSLVLELAKQLSVDQTSISVTGLGAGAAGAIATAIDHPQTYCALAPVCEDEPLPIPAGAAQQLKALAVAVCGSGEGAKQARDALAVKTDLFDGYADPRLYQWLLEQHRNP